MSKTFTRTNAATAGLMLSTFLAGPANAAVGELNSMHFNAHGTEGEIHVISSDGKTWDSIRPGNVNFKADLGFNSRGRGFVYRAGVVLGDCGGNSCKAHPILWGNHLIVRDWSYNDAPFLFNATSIPMMTGGGIPVMPDGGNILNTCNAGLENGKVTRSHSFTYAMPATFVVETDKATFLDYIPVEDGDSGFPKSVHHWRSDTFNVRVVCEGPKTPPSQDLAAPMPDFLKPPAWNCS